MPRFSIIVPVYNGEAFLRESLDSLVSQSFQDFEVICVNDCSTDSTELIMQEYESSDPRFRHINNKQNMSLFASRHLGVQITTGDYVLFLDADDAFTPNALESVDKHLKNKPVDILQFEMKVVIDSSSGLDYDENAWYAHKYNDVLLEGDEIIRTICYERADDMCMHHRAFRGDIARRVLPELGFEPGLIVAEDITELFALMIAASTYETISNSCWYIYNLGRGQNGHVDTLTCREFIEESARKRNCYDALIKYLDRTNAHTPLIDQAVASRWRYACAQSMTPWHTRVLMEEKTTALQEYVRLWPKPWVLPFVYEKIAYDANLLLSSGFSDDSKPIVRRMESVIQAVLPLTLDHESCNSALADEAQSIPKSNTNLFEAFIAMLDYSSNGQERIDTLLHYIHLYCLIEARQLCRISDLENEILWLQADFDEIQNSRRYKIGKIVSKPFDSIRKHLHRV